MAFEIRQRLENVEYDYDRESDVLYLSFGPPRPAVGIDYEDWLIVRIALKEPWIAGITIVGFQWFAKQLKLYEENLDRELSRNLQSLTNVTFTARYDDLSDVATYYWVDPDNSGPIFPQRIAPGIALEKLLTTNEVVGFRVEHCTKNFGKAVETMVGSILGGIENAPRRKKRKVRRNGLGDLEILAAKLAVTLNRSSVVRSLATP